MPLPSTLRLVGWEYKAMTFVQDATGVWVSVAEDGRRCWPRSAVYRLGQWRARGWEVVGVIGDRDAADAAERVTLLLRHAPARRLPFHGPDHEHVLEQTSEK